MNTQPLLLDLFAGAGGAGEGYARAGFRVVGVDLNPKPLRHNPHEHYVGDALAVLDTLLAGDVWQGYRLSDFAAIHASPPCQHYSVARRRDRAYPDLLPGVRERLVSTGKPWIIENVVGAPMWHGVMLCGSMFGLQVQRHRLFDSSNWLYAPGLCRHEGIYYTVMGHCNFVSTHRYDAHGSHVGVAVAREAMGIDWMTQAELSQAIPPAYTYWLGLQLMNVVEVAA